MVIRLVKFNVQSGPLLDTTSHVSIEPKIGVSPLSQKLKPHETASKE